MWIIISVSVYAIADEGSSIQTTEDAIQYNGDRQKCSQAYYSKLVFVATALYLLSIYSILPEQTKYDSP
jgi:hypothetical protein